MGFYIQGPKTGKAAFIVSEYDAKIISLPDKFEDIPDDKALIVVVNNGAFEAAGYCYCVEEFEAFSDIEDYRPKQWLIMDKKLAQELSGMVQAKKLSGE